MGIRQLPAVTFWTITALATFGCGGAEPALWPVSGKVLFRDGTPAAGIIEFTPRDGGPIARSRIASDGSFSLQTGDRAGAVAGTHRLAIVHHILADGFPQHAGKHVAEARIVNKRFAHPDTSGMIHTVEARTNVFVIEVEH